MLCRIRVNKKKQQIDSMRKFAAGAFRKEGHFSFLGSAHNRFLIIHIPPAKVQYLTEMNEMGTSPNHLGFRGS